MDLRSKSSSVADTPVLRSKSSVADTPVQARKGILKARSSSPVNVSEPAVKTKPLPEPPVAKTKPLPEPSAVKTKPLPESVSEPSQPDLKEDHGGAHSGDALRLRKQDRRHADRNQYVEKLLYTKLSAP
ncbi:unnamed protein product [Caenorhabditis auriculariae]|uniref:Uncharacterized protein n=1 Tax=Caenorhabditis auriculariae TaxID=2777116 RepID=A0A8S1HAC7_9PELO|nr:unnamed protein product [Caenorhabditis auriculariae]